MDKQRFLTAYLREFATIFTLAVLSFSLIGYIISNTDIEMPNISTINIFDGTGLPYGIILQLFGFSLIMAFLSRLIFSEYFAEKLSFILRYILFMLSTFFITALFGALFNWLPKDNIYAWFLFVPVFFVCFTIAILMSFLVMRLDDKKYNKLLENYKKGQNM